MALFGRFCVPCLRRDLVDEIEARWACERHLSPLAHGGGAGFGGAAVRPLFSVEESCDRGEWLKRL